MQTVFRSVHHPDDTPKGLVYARALAGPIGACTTPVMVGATAAALQGQTVWEFLVWGFPAALLVATAWTHFTLSTTVAEVRLQSGQCAIRSVQEVLRGATPQWHPLYDVRVRPWQIELALGWNTEVCPRADWPEYNQLRETAQHAVQSHTRGHANK